jgi:cysteinyl-tRNA synthetase
MRIYNTYTRSKEEFTPRTPGEVGMYVCGVTVYDLSHIGHARSAMVFDVIRRYLMARGHRVTFVRNFTDVDDRIIRRANQEGVPAQEVSERNIRDFQADMDALGVQAGDVEPKATEHIPQMIALIEQLIGRGLAYPMDGDVYFEVRRYPDYGRLSGKKLEELLAGARVDVDERKRDPRDFALWKAAKPGEPSWPSPWGAGRPGWHIECSAMAMQYLGPSFDIHGGGEDLIFPHHECEIAQSEGATGVRPFARVWVHNGFVNLGAEKMSKSLGNVLTIREIVKRHAADALRLWTLGTHYRSPLEWSDERVQQSARALERFTGLIEQAGPLGGAEVGPGEMAARPDAPAPWARALRALEGREPWRTPAAAAGEAFERAMDDDFNTPEAIAAMFGLARALGGLRDTIKTADDRQAFVAAVGVLVSLGRTLGLFERAPIAGGPPPEVDELVGQRTEARSRRDWARADQLRDAIQQLGWAVEDTPAGPRLTRRGG